MKIIVSERELETSIVTMQTIYDIFELTDLHLELDEITSILKSNPDGECELSPGLTLTYDETNRQFIYEVDEEIFHVQNCYARRLLRAIQKPLKAFALFIAQFQSWSSLKQAVMEVIDDMQNEMEQVVARRLNEK